MSSETTVRTARQWPWLCAIVAIVAAIYLPGLGNLPVFDDILYTDGQLEAVWGHLQLRPRMLSYGSFVWIDALFGDGLWKQRAANILIHVCVVIALWKLYGELLRWITPPRPDPGEVAQPLYESPALAICVGFFALNPVAVYAVAYLIQRSILLATLFVVAGLWLFARGLRTHAWWNHVLAVLCYALAVLSKEHAVLAPLAAMPIYVVVSRPPVKRLAIVTAVASALVGIAGGLLAQRYGNILGAPFDEFSRVYLAQLSVLNPDAASRAWSLSIENQAWLFFEYGVRWFVPIADWMSISLRPPFPVQWLSFPQVLGPLLYVATIASALVALLRWRDWRALAGLSVLLAALPFATEFATVWVQDPFVLYRSYLWAIGVPGIVFCFVHGPSTRVLAAIAVVLGLLLSWQSIERVLSLSTPETAWSDAIQKLSKDPRAVGRWFPYLNRGSFYAEHDAYELAIRDFEVSSTLGDMGMGSFNAGSMLSAKGQPTQALTMFDRAQVQGYDLYSLPFQRGIALQALGRTQEAYQQFDIAAAMQPPSPTREILQLLLGRAALRLGNPAVAVTDLTAYLAYDPGHAEARYLLALALVAKARPSEALAVLDKGSDAMKRTGPAHYARAVAYHALGQKADATREIETAIQSSPPTPVLREWQARIRAMP